MIHSLSLKWTHLLTFPIISSGLSSYSGVTRNSNRAFHYVPYGKSFKPPSLDDDADGDSNTRRLTISCDGRVSGTTLELTHWTGNDTPDSLYADTSTEMALNFARRAEQQYPEFHNAWVLNNHYDTDGVLSVWACLQPDMALAYEQLLVQAAEAGDFNEWSSDLGVKLDCAIGAFCADDDEEAAYRSVFDELPSLLEDMSVNEGRAYEDLWRAGYDDAVSGWEDVENGRVVLSQGKGQMVVVRERDATSRLSPYALHRALREKGLWKRTTRILRINTRHDSYYRYGYDKIGHGWVQKLKDRHRVPNVDGTELAKMLNERLGGDDVGGDTACFNPGGDSGLVSICRTKQFNTLEPNVVVQGLYDLDEGCRSSS